MKEPYIPKGCDQQGRHPDKSDIYAPPYSLTTLEDLEDLTDTEKREDKIVFYIMIAIIAVIAAVTIPMHLTLK